MVSAELWYRLLTGPLKALWGKYAQCVCEQRGRACTLGLDRWSSLVPDETSASPFQIHIHPWVLDFLALMIHAFSLNLSALAPLPGLWLLCRVLEVTATSERFMSSTIQQTQSYRLPKYVITVLTQQAAAVNGYNTTSSCWDATLTQLKLTCSQGFLLVNERSTLKYWGR